MAFTECQRFPGDFWLLTHLMDYLEIGMPYSQNLKTGQNEKDQLSDLGQQVCSWEKRACEVALEQEEGPQRVLVVGDANGLEFAEQEERESGAMQEYTLKSAQEALWISASRMTCTSVPAHELCAFAVCHQKLISWPKKELKTLFKPNLRIITWEENLRKLWEPFVRSQDTNLYAFFYFLRQRVVYI